MTNLEHVQELNDQDLDLVAGGWAQSVYNDAHAGAALGKAIGNAIGGPVAGIVGASVGEVIGGYIGMAASFF